MIRVLVVDDSLTVRKVIVEILEDAEGIEVVGEARDGQQAIDLALRLRPDVITMDLMMPGKTGLDATEYIMAHCPTRILIVSGSIQRAEVFRTYDALHAGALDVVEKAALGPEAGALVAKIRMVAKIAVIRHIRPRNRVNLQPSQTRSVRHLAIGASTGGPKALCTLLTALGATYPLPVLCVLHLSEAFAWPFVEWLQKQVPMPIQYAEHNQTVPTSGVVFAPPNHHMRVAYGRIQLDQSPPRHSCRPSVDVLFESLAATAGPSTIACLLTGMGRDGAIGLQALKAAGARTFVQDEASSAIYGMPKAALEIDPRHTSVGLEALGPMLRSMS